MANRGSINYCVRWDSTVHVTAAQRDAVHAALARQFGKWMAVMAGHNGWPYAQVPVKVVGWAVRDRAQLEWTDTSVDIYVNNIRENAPQCAEPCGRFFNQSGNYPNCPGGAAHHYDMSLWLTAGFGGGAGGDWGQRIGSEYLMSNLNADNVHILLHEMGHSFGLDDFYDWTPTGQCCFIMKAGSATQITEFDKWMFRDWWRHLKNRYGY
ncbi:immune inhibitor A [Micromonospora narathiwatensis]|uniref:immune inhibitor A n=1 Tax=Micromonospora narathiwatensis TaxID=299146 RepID=UPI000A4EE08B|nr:immune inhibitor A [Micromonospora narathiwatensis]